MYFFTLKKSRKCFNHFLFQDHSGKLSRPELESILTRLLMTQPGVTKAECAKLVGDIFHEIDANGDGQISRCDDCFF